MDNLMNGTTAAADSAEAENTVSAATELGKFKDVKALIEAYGNLEAEFTRRSQRLKELENASKAEGAPCNRGNASPPSRTQEVYSGADFVRAARESAEVRDAVIGDYLKSIAENKGVAFLSGGSSVSAARRTPQNIREAGELARTYLK